MQIRSPAPLAFLTLLTLSATALLAVLIAVLAPRPAAASPITLTFNEFSTIAAPAVAAGNGVGYFNANHMSYGNVAPNILLSDDGMAGQITFSATAGVLFDPYRLTLLEGRRGVLNADYDPLVGPDPWSQVFAALDTGRTSDLIHDNLVMQGYRWGDLIAETRTGFAGTAAEEFLFPAEFTGLTRLDISLDFAGANHVAPQIIDDTIVWCNGSCGFLRFDDLVVDISSQPVGAAAVEVASMPIPASWLLLTAACGAIAAAARRSAPRRSAPRQKAT